jgi:hypothetical protein
MPSLTRSDLVTRIGDLVGDPDHTRWTEPKKQQKIDEWQENFIVDTKALKDVLSTPVVSGTSEYDLPTDILDILRASHNGLPLSRTSEYDLDAKSRSNWSLVTGTPTDFYVDLDPDNKKYRLYPIPSTPDASYPVIMEYVKIPPSLTTDASVPFNGHTLMTPYHMAIAYGAASDFLKMELRDNPNAQAVALTISAYGREYDKLKIQCIETFKAMGNAEPIQFARGRYF